MSKKVILMSKSYFHEQNLGNNRYILKEFLERKIGDFKVYLYLRNQAHLCGQCSG